MCQIPCEFSVPQGVHLEDGPRWKDQIMNPCEMLTQTPASREPCCHRSPMWAPPDNGLDQRGPSLFFPASSELFGVLVCCWGLKQGAEEVSV